MTKLEKVCSTRIHPYCRRDFLKLAVAAGLVTGCTAAQEVLPTETLLPTVEPQLMQTNTPEVQPTEKPTAIPTYSLVDFQLMSYCGIRCTTACPESAYPSACAGCKAQSGPQASYNAVCPVRKCASEKQMLTCGHCPDYDNCTADTWTIYPGLRTRIQKIRDYLATKT